MSQEADPTDPMPTSESAYGDAYKEHLFRQYTMYVESADRVSTRRALANTFFLTASAILLSVDGFSTSQQVYRMTGYGLLFLLVFTVGSAVLSFTWFLVLRSYDKLNGGKFEVIHRLEKALPASLYSAEWAILGGGKDPRKYRPISKLEADVPLVFVAIYAALFVATVASYLLQVGL